jgi:hypothetical protein
MQAYQDPGMRVKRVTVATYDSLIGIGVRAIPPAEA